MALPLSAQELCFCASASGCTGGMLADAWQHIKYDGLVTGTQQLDTTRHNPYPFASLKLCSRYSLPHCHHHGPQRDDPYPAEGAAGCEAQSSPDCPGACDKDAQAPHNNYQARYSFSGEVHAYDQEEDIRKAIMEQGPVEAAMTVYSDFENYAGGIYHHVSGGNAGGHAVRIVGWGAENGTKYWKVANSWNPYWGESGYFRIRRGTGECGIEDSVVANAASTSWNLPKTR